MTQQVFPLAIRNPVPRAVAGQEETALPVGKETMPATGHTFLVWLVTAVTLGSGLVNLYSVIGPGLPERVALLRTLFPLEFLDGSRFLAALVGFALVVLSINVYKRKRRAFTGVVLLSLASVLLHLTKSLDYEEASLSLALLGLLLWARPSFTVRSMPLDLRAGLLRFALALAVAFGYGTAGFWLLDHREFGLAFSLPDAVHKALLQLSRQDLGLHPHTRYARWFLDSLDLMTLAAGGYALTALFRPVLYRYSTLESERRLARGIVERHGRSVQDFFKYAADKSLFFSPARTCFLAYRVADDYALVMGDPVGPEGEIEALVRDFADYCAANGWSVGFHGVLPDFLPIYRRLGFRRLKIGDDAVVDLTRFSLDGKDNKSFRYRINRLEKAGVRCEYWAAPLPEEVVRQAQEVSAEWLRLPGRRERSFTLGCFEPDYIRSTPLWGAVDGEGRLLAFLNIIPSYTPGEATVDLMRYRLEAPNGLMDYLLVKHFLFLKEQGYARFNLGMAPLAGFGEQESASIEERAIHYFVHHLNFLFRFSGLLQYKAKYANTWEPRYEVFAVGLVLLAVLAVYLLRRPPDRVRTGRLGRLNQLGAGWMRLAGELRRLGTSRAAAAAFGLSLACVVLQILAFWLVMPACGLSLSFWQGMLVLFVVRLGTLVPSAPGNVGTYQFFCVAGLTMLGVEKHQAVGFSVVVFAVLTVPLWLIGSWALQRSGVSLSALRAEFRQWHARPQEGEAAVRTIPDLVLGTSQDTEGGPVGGS